MSEEDKETGYIDILIECRFCGAMVPDDFECIKCGTELLEEADEGKVYYACSVCRAKVDDDVLSCPGCNTSFA